MLLLTAIAGVYELIEKARDEVNRTPEINRDLYWKPIARIETILSQLNFDGQWAATANAIDEPTLTGLEFCAEAMDRLHGEEDVSSELTELREQLEELVNRVVAEADLPEAVKTLIVDGLERVRRGILLYQLYGAQGLRRAVEADLGSFMLRQDQIKGSEQRKSVKDYLELLSRTIAVVGKALRLAQVLGPAVRGLLGGGK